MIQKIKSLLVVACFISATAFSQEVTGSHAIGTSGFIKGRFSETYSEGITYASRLNFLFFGSEHSLSVGTTFTMFPVWSSVSGANKPWLTFDIPVTIDANFGHASDDDAESDIGAFVGLGPCYNNLWDFDYDDYYNQRYYTGRGGIVFNGGIRFETYYFGSYTLRGSYMLNLGKGHNVIGVSLLLNLGDY